MNSFLKLYNDCIRIAQWHGANLYDAQDIVQNFYLGLAQKDNLERYKIDGEPNKGYVFISIRNQFLKHKAIESRYVVLDESFLKQKEPVEVIYEEELFNAMKDLRWYDRTLFEIYVQEDHSVRSLAQATGINYISIFRTIKEVKEKLQCIKD